MDYPDLDVVCEEHVALMTVRRPDVLNALNASLLCQIESALIELQVRKEIRVLVITGAGRAFVAGGDIGEMAEMDQLKGREYVLLGQRVLWRMENSRLPIIAAVNGFALGGGCELALACDIRLASEDARFGQPEVGLGIIPGFGGSQRLARICGPGVAKDLVLTGRIIRAQEALSIGLVSAVFPASALISEARKMADVIASKAPFAVNMAKAVIGRGYDSSFHTGCHYEVEAFELCMSHPDAKEGLDAFLSKKSPKWTS